MRIEDVVMYNNPDAGTIEQIERAVQHEAVVGAALMADNHLGYAVPIGGVIAYDGHISPSGVGFDIACGNMAVKTDMNGDELRKNIADIMDDVWKRIAFGVGRSNKDAELDDEVFSLDTWSNHDFLREFKPTAQKQLGTVGSGNHYVDIFTDETDAVWVGNHFGSRGLGHKIATHFLKAGGAKDGMQVEPLVLSVSSDLGAQYLDCMALAGQYAYAGREWVCRRVMDILGANAVDIVHNHHNFAWLEGHGDWGLWVVRKGATPAFPGQRGFVGGSMGENSVILEGVDSGASVDAFHSTIHGAGRAMSRTQAKGKTNRKTGEVKEPGCVSQEMMDKWVGDAKVELRGAGVDESPHCYKRLPEVLACHSESIRILHTLTTVGVAMAGNDVFDPYKD